MVEHIFTQMRVFSKKFGQNVRPNGRGIITCFCISGIFVKFNIPLNCKLPFSSLGNRKKPEVVKKNGTAVRAITLVSIKSKVSENPFKGEV